MKIVLIAVLFVYESISIFQQYKPYMSWVWDLNSKLKNNDWLSTSVRILVQYYFLNFEKLWPFNNSIENEQKILASYALESAP